MQDDYVLLRTVHDTENLHFSIGNPWVVAGQSTFVHVEIVGYL